MKAWIKRALVARRALVVRQPVLLRLRLRHRRGAGQGTRIVTHGQDSTGDFEVDEVAAELVCGYAGHDWLDAGGGLLICGECHAEKWEDERDPA